MTARSDSSLDHKFLDAIARDGDVTPDVVEETGETPPPNGSNAVEKQLLQPDASNGREVMSVESKHPPVNARMSYLQALYRLLFCRTAGPAAPSVPYRRTTAQ